MKNGLKQTPIFQEISENTFDINAACTITGFSSITTRNVYCTFQGNMVYIDFFVQGTSNATSFTIVLPFIITMPNLTLSQICNTNVQNNSAFLAAPGIVQITGAQTRTLLLYTTAPGGAWTASGTKASRGQIITFLSL